MPFLCELENTSILRQGIQNLPWMDRLVRTEKAAVARARGGLGLVHVVDVDPQKLEFFWWEMIWENPIEFGGFF